ncbi:hypothetical protein H5410_031894 [Solanum commersonii]|uniref:Putative plant transposon protein domain-containing protein n=1 Tax=Solanum commersonii TaxID=4109 RepID=A0A9J5YN18_SOLCO|nr:hypothetical protein H5410_031894 [Solanum commersonii]
MARMFGMAELQLWIDGRRIIDAEMETMAERYPLSESTAFLCKTGPAFLEPLDDDEATDDEATDNVVDGETNALMVFNGVTRVCLNIVCSVLLPAKHLTEVTRDRVVLVYMLMKGMPIKVRAILRQNMMKFRNNLRWRFCYESLITHFLRADGIEEETVDMTVAYHPNLTGKLVDVTRTKALDSSQGPIMSAPER